MEQSFIRNTGYSNIKIDILIPVIEKDFEVLPFVIDAARKNIMHPIGDFRIIAPFSNRIIDLCKQLKCVYVDEETILPIKKESIGYHRKGWLFQQFLKLNGDAISQQEHYFVIDADTVLIRPHLFIQNERTVFYYRKHSHGPYFVTLERLLGMKAAPPPSFVAHYMLFEKKKVKQLRKKIESTNKKEWYAAIIDCITTKNGEKATFSEFETYGNFIYKNYPDQLLFERAQNLNLKREEIVQINNLNKAELARKYRSISYHSWNKNK